MFCVNHLGTMYYSCSLHLGVRDGLHMAAVSLLLPIRRWRASSYPPPHAPKRPVLYTHVLTASLLVVTKKKKSAFTPRVCVRAGGAGPGAWNDPCLLLGADYQNVDAVTEAQSRYVVCPYAHGLCV
jgi:hypothetical protein